MKYLGCAYYPEYHQGNDRFETDAKLMQQAGINLARIGESAWSAIEPAEGKYNFDLLNECITTFNRHGIRVMACVPTAAPPAWLATNYPETLLVRADGVRGARRLHCPTNETYRKFGAKIAEVASQQLAHHENIIALQLDDELGSGDSACFCESCQTRFRAWLKERYESVDELNSGWGAGFHGGHYSDWKQVVLSDGSDGACPSRSLDSKRFWSDMAIEFLRQQAEIARRNMPNAILTTNGTGPICGPVDYYKLFADLDVASANLYFDAGSMDTGAATMNVFRSIKPGKRHWIVETGIGALSQGKPPSSPQFRAWAWSSLAHGAEAHMVFPWRSNLSGEDQEIQGIVERSGQTRGSFRAVQNCFAELRRMWEQLETLPAPDAPVAIVHDYDTLWTYESSKAGQAVNYRGLLHDIHRTLYRRNVLADFVPLDRVLSQYRLLILPSTLVIAPDFANRLALYVRNGGTLLAIGQIGMRDINGNYLPYQGPDNLQELLGVRVEGGMYLESRVEADEALCLPEPKSRSVEIAVAGALGAKKAHGKAGAWVGDISLAGGNLLMRFTEDAYAEQPAVVSRQTGGGMAIYVATTRLDESLFGEVMDFALSQARVPTGVATPEHVEAVRRGNCVFLINHTAAQVSVRMETPKDVIAGAYRAGAADLGPYGVCALKY